MEYVEAKVYAAKMDLELGFRISEIEKKLSKVQDANYWIGLAPEILQTPYSEFFEIMNRLNLHDGSLIIDIGAAYGRLGHVIGKSFPNQNFLGFEVVRERVQEGNRVLALFNYPNVCLKEADVSMETFCLPVADVYFIYDFGNADHIRKILADVGEISKTKSVKVVGRGRLSRDLIERENPWLSQVVSPQHFKNYSIYQTILV